MTTLKAEDKKKTYHHGDLRHALLEGALEVLEEVGVQGLSLRGVVVPVTLAALVRQDAGAWGLWGGAGGAAAVHRVELWAGESLVTRGHRALFGPVALIGGGRRLLGGEAVLELRASWLTGSAGEVGYRGNLGGLGVATGWRVVY